MSNLFANLLIDDVVIENFVPVKRAKIEEVEMTSVYDPSMFGTDEKTVKAVKVECMPEMVGKEEIVDTSKMSNRERKRFKKRENQLIHRQEKRKLEKARRKERKKLARESADSGTPMALKPATYKMIDSNCKIRVAIDLAFEKLMNENGIRKTIVQLNFCYAVNRHAVNPLQYYIVNLREKTKTIFDSQAGNNRWDVFMMEETLEQLWRPEEIVYLSADSSNVLKRLEENKTYVIGGLVDHNAYKGVCHASAVKKGFSHARLPIDEFVKLQTRKVLTINHVFEILLHFSVSNNWEEAFFSVIPKRKGLEKLNKNKNNDVSVILKEHITQSKEGGE